LQKLDKTWPTIRSVCHNNEELDAQAGPSAGVNSGPWLCLEFVVGQLNAQPLQPLGKCTTDTFDTMTQVLPPI
jgi:hypothetical protein